MKVVGLTIAVVFCLCLIFPAGVGASEDGTQAEIADLRAQLQAIQLKIDILTTQQTVGLGYPAFDALAVASVGQCAGGSCAVASSSRSTARVSVTARTGQRQGFFGRFRARRGGCG